jgi:hypothetical protein
VSGTLPDRFLLFRRPILDEWADGEHSLERLVAHILIHEAGHHFGFSMSVFYAYIATKTTADPYIPPRTVSLDTLARDAADGFAAVSGGRTHVGQLAFFPLQRSDPNHLHCDGRELSKAPFADLYSLIGTAEARRSIPRSSSCRLHQFGPPPAVTAQPETETEGTFQRLRLGCLRLPNMRHGRTGAGGLLTAAGGFDDLPIPWR